jgi:hypothetical protein
MVQTKTYEDTLGQILTGSGLITIDDLNEALELQKSTGQKVGEILLSRHFHKYDDVFSIAL